MRFSINNFRSCLQTSVRRISCLNPVQTRTFRSTSLRRTDGVFRELTAARVQTPWIEAFRARELEGHDPSKATGKPKVPANRNLAPKRMSDSYHSVVSGMTLVELSRWAADSSQILPLGHDKWLLDTYTNATGHIRLGTIFMDLDALSGVIAYKHTGDDVTTVTAAFDRITIRRPLLEICDLELSGQVTYATGRSSMGISLQVAKAPKQGEKVRPEDVLLTCSCTMVSLDPGTRKPVPVNPLIIETEEEKRLFAIGERNAKERKEQGQTSLFKYTPNDEESDVIHAIWQKQIKYHDPNDAERKPANVQLMESTRVQTAAIMQPQYRNRHNFMIFGGFLLKQTFELAFCCAAAFSHSRPTFLSLDPSTFENPVPVGSVLYLTATVVYTDPSLVDEPGKSASSAPSGFTRVQVRVDSKVRNVEHGETKPTGTFNYTFSVEKDIKVMPKTYGEFMLYIDARRRAKLVAESMESQADQDHIRSVIE